MFILLLAYRHNSLCSSTTYRSNDHGYMSMIVDLPDVVPQHPCPTLIYCALVQYSVSATGGFQIFSFNSTMHSTKEYKPSHVSQARWLPKSYRIHSESHFTSLFLFLNKDGKYHKHALGPTLGRGVAAWRRDRREESSEGQMFHLKRQQRASFFRREGSWGEHCFFF